MDLDLDLIVNNILKAGAFLAGLAALIGVYVSRRNGVKGDERAARDQELATKRDTVADRDALIDQLQEDMKDVRGRITHLEDALERKEQQLAAEREYSRLLLDWGYRGGPPPPPGRPAQH